MINRFACLLALSGGLVLAACSPKAPVEAPAETAAAAAEPAPCADDGPRFPITGLCVGRSVNYLSPEDLVEIPAPEGCSWQMQEAAFGPDEAVLFRALSCEGKDPTRLEFAGGAQTASLAHVSSALGPLDFGPDGMNQIERIRLFPLNPTDAKQTILTLFETIPEADRAKCHLTEATPAEAFPQGALVIAPVDPAADAPGLCGMYGVPEGGSRFWLIRQGYAWFFDLPGDGWDVDPGSFMLFGKGESQWAPLP